jgi:hypothetical protein
MLLMLSLGLDVFVGCAGRPATTASDASSSNPLPAEIAIKERLLKEVPHTQAEPLKVGRIIKKDKGGAFIVPASIASSEEGEAYISDNRGNVIHYCPSNSLSVTTLPQQSGNGQLRFPKTIHKWKDLLFVSDNDGIKIFKQDGSFHRMLRTYYGIFHFTVSARGAIYANASFRDLKAADSLIIELNENGTRINGFGKRLNHSDYYGLDDRAYLSTTGNFLLAAFQLRPIVQIYNCVTGKLVRECRLNNPIFSKLEQLSEDKKFVHPSPGKVALPRFVAGIRAIKDRMFVLLHLPYPEIIELDIQGQERGRYRSSDLPTAIDYFGFDARFSEGRYIFSIGMVDSQWIPALVEVSVNKANGRFQEELR